MRKHARPGPQAYKSNRLTRFTRRGRQRRLLRWQRQQDQLLPPSMSQVANTGTRSRGRPEYSPNQRLQRLWSHRSIQPCTSTVEGFLLPQPLPHPQSGPTRYRSTSLHHMSPSWCIRSGSDPQYREANPWITRPTSSPFRQQLWRIDRK